MSLYTTHGGGNKISPCWLLPSDYFLAMLNVLLSVLASLLPTQKQPSVSVLGMKRSNIITITLSRLPPPHLLPLAIYSMDNSVLDREDVQVWESCMLLLLNIKQCRWEHNRKSNRKWSYWVDLFLHPIKQRLQALIPTDDELCLIKEAKAQNPHCLLAPAEVCLFTLGQIPHLSSRLQLWSFALDYDSLERVNKFKMKLKITVSNF